GLAVRREGTRPETGGVVRQVECPGFRLRGRVPPADRTVTLRQNDSAVRGHEQVGDRRPVVEPRRPQPRPDSAARNGRAVRLWTFDFAVCWSFFSSPGPIRAPAPRVNPPRRVTSTLAARSFGKPNI